LILISLITSSSVSQPARHRSTSAPTLPLTIETPYKPNCGCRATKPISGALSARDTADISAAVTAAVSNSDTTLSEAAQVAKLRRRHDRVVSSRGNCPTASTTDFAEPVELLLLPGSHAGSCAGTRGRTRAPVLTSLVPSCTPLLASLMPSCAPLLTPLHANGLGLGIGNRQRGSGCCNGEASTLCEKRESLSTRDRFRFDDFTHGQNSTVTGERIRGRHSKVPVLI